MGIRFPKAGCQFFSYYTCQVSQGKNCNKFYVVVLRLKTKGVGCMGIKAPSWVFLQSRHLGLSPKPLHYTRIVRINHCFQIEDLGSLEDCGCGNLGDVTWVMIRLY
jgi:hypothetical protein